MISEEKLLNLKTRRTIYKTVLENPGIHQRALERKIDIASGALRYHISILIKLGMIIKKCEHGYTRYFVSNTVGNGDKKILAILRQKIPRKILLLLLLQSHLVSLTKEQIMNLAEPERWKEECRESYKIRLDPTTVNYHLQKLIDAGLVERIRDGRKISYRIVDEDMLSGLAIRYHDTLNDDLVDTALNWLDTDAGQNRFDFVVNCILDIFPNPYYV